MLKVFLFFGVLISSIDLFSQNSYVVQYDKPSDKFIYKKIVFESNGARKEVDLKSKLPKLNFGDNVVVEVTNYNPFLYYVSIESEDMKVSTGKKSNTLGLLSLMTGGLAPLTSFVSSLTSIQTELDKRGSETLATDESELELYSIETKAVNLLIKDYQNKYESYQKILSDIESENLQQDVKTIVLKLEEVYRNYYNPTDKIELLSSSTKFHFNKAGILNDKLKESAKSFDYQLNKFKELLADPLNSYNKKGIEEWISKLKTAEFQTKKSFVVSSESKLFTIDESEENKLKSEALVGMNYKIKFYRLKDLKEIMFSEEETTPNYVKYFFFNKFWNSKGEIVDTICEDCDPVLRAEGLYTNKPPRNYESIFEDFEKDTLKLNEYAIGKWKFYSTDGKISYVLIAPDSEPIRKNKKIEVNTEKLSQVYSVVKTVDIPLNKGMVMNWSTGLYSLGSFKERNSYFSKDNSTMDSVTIGQTSLSRSRICIGSQMVFDFQGNKLITPTLNLGAAVDFWDDRDIHFIVGGGLKFKKFPFMSLTAGVAFTQVNVLNKALQVGQSYDSYYDLLDESTFQTKKYVPGYFVGLNINL